MGQYSQDYYKTTYTSQIFELRENHTQGCNQPFCWGSTENVQPAKKEFLPLCPQCALTEGARAQFYEKKSKKKQDLLGLGAGVADFPQSPLISS